MFLVSSCSCLCSIHWSQVLSQEWRCSWSSADRRCSNYIWVIDIFFTYLGAYYIRDFYGNFNVVELQSLLRLRLVNISWRVPKSKLVWEMVASAHWVITLDISLIEYHNRYVNSDMFIKIVSNVNSDMFIKIVSSHHDYFVVTLLFCYLDCALVKHVSYIV